MRHKTIDYQRVTFSFPKMLALKLRVKVGQNNISGYVAALVEEDLNRREVDADGIIRELKEFRLNEVKSKKSSMEILREIRYGSKY